MDQFMEFIRELFYNIRIQDFFDIAIVAYVFYRAIGLIKETRAGQLIRGIILILLATQISEWIGLYTIHWILRNTMTVGVIVLIVVFQPELRRALKPVSYTHLE